MFDIGFSELLLFGVIALIVLGPEKLPAAARTAGQWYAKLRRTVGALQSEIEAELDLAETRKMMQEELAKIRESEAQMRREMNEMRGNIREFESVQNQSLHHQDLQLQGLSPHRSTAAPASDLPGHHDKQIHAPITPDYAYGSDKFQTAFNAQTSDTQTNPINNKHADTMSAEASLSDADGFNNNASDERFDDRSDGWSDDFFAVVTKPWENQWFLLGNYDKVRRLPAPPYLPNYKADTLLNADLHLPSHARSEAQL